MSKLGFLLFMLGAGGMDSPDVTVPAIMVLSGIGIIGISAFLERRKEYGISYRVLQWKMPKLRKRSKRLVGVVFYIERRSDYRHSEDLQERSV